MDTGWAAGCAVGGPLSGPLGRLLAVGGPLTLVRRWWSLRWGAGEPRACGR